MKLLHVVLLGKNGQIGFELQRSLSPYAIIHAFGRMDLDLCDFTTLRSKLLTIKPDIIINAAAWTQVDQAEEASSSAFQLNADLVAVLADLAMTLECWLIHYSTDYVFDGQQATPYIESDPPNPLSVYGHSKWAGEQAIMQYAIKHLIFRTSWVYSTRRLNFPAAILKKAQTQESIEVIADGCGAPTSAALIADITALAVYYISQEWLLAHDSGIYHLTAQGQTSWFEYAVYLVEQAQQQGMSLKLTSDRILPIARQSMPSLAMRPRYSCLNTEKLRTRFKIILPHWQDNLRHWLLSQTFI